MFELLSYSPVFAGISPHEIENILGALPHQVRTFKKGEMVVQAEEECLQLLIIIAGRVKGEMVDVSGKILKIEEIESPRPLAPAFLFGKQNRYPVNIIAETPTSVLYIPKAAYLKLMQQQMVVLQNYLDVIANRSQFLSRRIRFLSFKTLKGKLAHYILELSKRQGDEVNLPQTQQDLADFFGVTRPSLARALGEMEKEGLIEAHRKLIRIVDKAKMFLLLQ